MLEHLRPWNTSGKETPAPSMELPPVKLPSMELERLGRVQTDCVTVSSLTGLAVSTPQISKPHSYGCNLAKESVDPKANINSLLLDNAAATVPRSLI
jgi:hypothetical protein